MDKNFTLACLFAATAFAQSTHAAEPTDGRYGRNLAGTCTGCHGTAGQSQGGMPVIAGQPRDELLRKMQEFRSGARPGTIMPQLAKGYTDAQLEAMAAYFAAQSSR